MPIMTPQNLLTSSGLIKALPWIIVILLAAVVTYQFTNTNLLKEDIKARDVELDTLREQLPKILEEADSTETMAIRYKDKLYIELGKIPALKDSLNATVENVNSMSDSALLRWATERYRTDD